MFTRRWAYKWRGCLLAAVYVIQDLSFFRLVCMNLIQSSFLLSRLLPVILPGPDLDMGAGVGGRSQYCYEGRNVNQQGDVETRNKTITVASFLFIFSIIIFLQSWYNKIKCEGFFSSFRFPFLSHTLALINAQHYTPSDGFSFMGWITIFPQIPPPPPKKKNFA